MGNVYQKILNVMNEVQYLQKDDMVQTGKDKGYKAITEEKVTNAVRQALIKNKLVIIPTDMEVKKEKEKLTDAYGNEKLNHFTSVDVEYRIQNVEDPDDYVIAVSSGTGVDTQDKGVGKAMTYAYKYLLLRTFAIPTGEDTDKISSEMYSSQFTATSKKINKKTEHELRAKIQEEKIPTAKVVEVLKQYEYKTLQDIEEKKYLEVMSLLFAKEN